MVQTKKNNVSTPRMGVKVATAVDVMDLAKLLNVSLKEAYAEIVSMGYKIDITGMTTPAQVKASPVVTMPKEQTISMVIKGIAVNVPVVEQETAKGNPSLRNTSWKNIVVGDTVYNIPPFSITMTVDKKKDTPKPTTKTTKRAWIKDGEDHLKL